MLPQTIATEPVFVTGPDGVRRLAAAVGDVLPVAPPTVGIVTPPDPVSATVEPIIGYDALTEEQVLALLPELDADTLEAVRAYERTHLARGSIHQHGLTATVVNATSSPAPPATPLLVPAESVAGGYTAMSPAALQAEIDRRVITVTGSGANGRVLKKDQVAALQADDAAKANQA